MKRSKELLTALVNENYLKTKEIIHEELYSKVGSAIDEIREDAYAAVFDEAKKAKKSISKAFSTKKKKKKKH